MRQPPNGDVPLIEVYLYSTAKDSFFGDSPYYWFSKIFGDKIFLPQMGGFKGFFKRKSVVPHFGGLKKFPKLYDFLFFFQKSPIKGILEFLKTPDVIPHFGGF